MPYYLFQHPSNQEVIQVFQNMNDNHTYEKDGIKWNRVFTNPRVSIDTKVDPYSEKDFVRKMNKTCKVQDMMDESKELSEKRASVNGIDPLKQKVFDDYKKNTKGKSHPEDREKRIETKDIIIDL